MYSFLKKGLLTVILAVVIVQCCIVSHAIETPLTAGKAYAVQEVSGTKIGTEGSQLILAARTEGLELKKEAVFAKEEREREEQRKREEQERKKKEEEERKKTGQEVVDYACQFIGNPYVWGGTSLTKGADCSGFVQAVYKHFDVSLPRTSGEQRSAGCEVSYSEARAGDIICYDGHVGIYMGDGQIVNAINRARGIGILSATYDDIKSVRRVL